MSRVSQPASVEPEIDLGRYLRRVVRRFWFPLAGVVLALVTALPGRASNDPVFEARSVLFIGQPRDANGTALPAGLNANPATAAAIVNQPAVQQAAAQAVGLKPKALCCGRVVASVVAGSQAAGTRGITPPLYQITVRGPWGADQAAAAANQLANEVVIRTSEFQTTKQTLIEAQRDDLVQRAADADAAIKADRESLAALEAQPATPTNAALKAPLLTSLALTGDLVWRLREQLSDAEINLEVVRKIETSRLVTEAVGRRVDVGASRRALVTRVIVGFLLGSLAAILLPPFRLRKRQ